MSNLAVRAENLGKRYRIGTREERHDTLAGTLLHTLKAPLRNLQRLRRLSSFGDGESKGIVWALQGISFEVKHGEVLGIIGRNGAGKSTLLKVLSRITEPTTGRAEVHGRVGSLLEVGTGFHPDLTGRENVYLNGSVLGMDRRSINRKFDEIVDFAGVEQFIDTPVKRYSSGMYLRLAFAVAAHLEPEILIVDEVLAVGDAEFQKKCLGKMDDVAKTGRTVLFVSHNMSAVLRMCPRALLLGGGRVIADGPAHQVVQKHLQSRFGTTAIHEWEDLATAPGNEIVRLRAVRVRTEAGEISETHDIRNPIRIEMEYQVLKPDHVLIPNFHFFNDEDICVFVTIDPDLLWRRRPRPAGRYRSTAWIPGNLLAEGTLYVKAAITTHSPHVIHISERDVVAFHVVDTMEGDSARGGFGGEIIGVVRPLLKWDTQADFNACDADAEMVVAR